MVRHPPREIARDVRPVGNLRSVRTSLFGCASFMPVTIGRFQILGTRIVLIIALPLSA